MSSYKEYYNKWKEGNTTPTSGNTSSRTSYADYYQEWKKREEERKREEEKRQQEEAQRQQEERNKQIQEEQQRAKEREEELNKLNEKAKANMSSEVKDKIDKLNAGNLSKDEEFKLMTEIDNIKQRERTQKLVNETDGLFSTENAREITLSEIEAEKKAEKRAKEINEAVEDGNYLLAFGHWLEGLPEGMKSGIAGIGEFGLNTIASDLNRYGKWFDNEDLLKASNDLIDKSKDLKGQTSYYSKLNSKIDNNVVRTGGNVTNTIGEMIPSIASNAVLPGSGVFVTGAQVAGQESTDEINANRDNLDKAMLTGTAKGTAAGMVEKIVGGDFISEGLADKLATKGISKVTTNKFAQKLLWKSYQVGGEVVEENVEDSIDDIIDAIINEKDLPSLEEKLNQIEETSKITGLSTLVLNTLGLGGGDFDTAVKETQISDLNNDIKKLDKQISKETDTVKIDELNQELNWKQKQLDALTLPTANTFKPTIQENQELPTAQEIQVLPKANFNPEINQQTKEVKNNIEELPVGNVDNTYSNKLRQTATEEIKNSNISAEDKATMLKALDNTKTVTDADINAIKNTIEENNIDNVANNKNIVYNDSKGEIENEFRRLQDESRNLSNEEKQLYRNGSKEIDSELRGRLSRVLGERLGSISSSNSNDARVLKDAKSGNTFNIYSNVDGQTFRDCFEIAKTYTKNNELVDLHPVKSTKDTIGYNDTKNYISKDGLSGYSITPDGDLISVFNANDKRGWLRAISQNIKKDAKTLDCYMSDKQPLSKMYEKIFGFKTAAVMDYNMEYDHDDIAKNHNKPQVAFMVNTDQDVETKHFNKDQYDEAVAYRNSFLNNTKNSNKSSFNLQEENSLVENPYNTKDNSIDTAKTENEQKEIGKVLEEPIKKVKKKNRIWAIAKANIIDKYIVFEELARKTKNKLLDAKTDYMRTSEARAQAALEDGRFEQDPKTKKDKKVAKSLEEIRSEVGKKTADFQNYMYHQLNIDRMTLEDRYGKANKPVFGDDVTAEVSKEKVAEYEEKYPEFKEYAKDVYDFLDANMKELVNNGVISQELSDKLKEIYPHYVPIERVDAKGFAIKVPLDTHRTGVNAPLAKATGGSSNIQPLFYTIGNRTKQTYLASARNSFGLELMNTLNSTKEVSQTDLDNIIEQIGDPDEETKLLKKGENGENPTFTVFNNGEKVTFEITEDMYDALKPQSDIIKNINNSRLAKVGRTIGNIRRGVLTEYNPVFMFTNSIKDAQDIVVNSDHPVKTYSKIPEAYAQIMKKGYWYNEYMRNGGKQNSYFKDGEFITDKKSSKLKTAITFPLETISKVNNVVETAPRLAEYIASREMGRSIEEAMLDAARVTTNFKAGGDWTKTLNRNGVTFLNASVQGFQQQVRNIQEARAKGLKGYAALATKYAIAGLPAILLNNLIWKDDEDYQNLQDYTKDNYYIIAKLGNGKFLRIPKGRVAATVQKIVSNATEYMTDDKQINIDNLGKDFWEDIKFAQDNIAPNNPFKNNIISPLLDVAQNKAWYGEDLVPKRLQDKPAKEQYDETTDSFSIWLGDKLNVSPYKINYLLDQYGGGLSDVVLPKFTKQAENNVFEDKFTTDAIMKNKYPGEFYDTLDKLKTKANSSNATDEDLLKYKYLSSLSSNSGEMSNLYKEKREIQNSNKTDDKKKEELKVVQKKINKIAEDALNNADNIKISGNTATVNKDQYYKCKNVSDESIQWNKLSDSEKEKNKDIPLKTYADYKNSLANETIKQRKNGTLSNSEQLKNKDKIETILNSSYTNKEKSAIYENYIGQEDDVYQILKETDIDIDQYLKYKQQEFTADKIDDGTLSGKSVSGSKKEKIRSYIDNMEITYMQKLLLYGTQYPLSDNEQTQIVNYINSLNKTKQQKLDMLSKYKGFTIYKDGRFTY